MVGGKAILRSGSIPIKAPGQEGSYKEIQDQVPLLKGLTRDQILCEAVLTEKRRQRPITKQVTSLTHLTTVHLSVRDASLNSGTA